MKYSIAVFLLLNATAKKSSLRQLYAGPKSTTNDEEPLLGSEVSGFVFELDQIDQQISMPEEKFLQKQNDQFSQKSQKLVSPNSMRFDYKADEIISLT
jgi:hypothetical protein